MICTMTHGIELSQPVVQKLEKCVERVHALSSDKASSLRRMDCTLTPTHPPTNTVLAGESEMCFGQQVPEQGELRCKNQNQAGCL